MQDSLGFWIPHHEFHIPCTGFRILSQGNLDSRFQLFVEFQIPGPRIPDSTRKISLILDATSKHFLDSRFPYMGQIKECTCSLLILVHVHL